MMSDDEDLDCPLCMEEFDIADRNFRPCPCGYQICRFCWHHIKTNLNGQCPACRRAYTDQIAQFIPVSAEEILRSKREKKEKDKQQKEMKDSSRRHLTNMRVVQKNLVYVLGLAPKYASTEDQFFKKYGKVVKLVVSRRTALSGTQGSSGQSSVGIYVTYARKEDAAKAVEAINGTACDGKAVRASFGTTKYCSYYLRHMNCPNPNCMYLHEQGNEADSYSKEDLTVGGKNPIGPSSAQSYPNKRAALTTSASASTISTSASKTKPTPTTTADVPSAPKKSAWAPIPKPAPPPKLVVDPVPEKKETPILKGSSSTITRNTKPMAPATPVASTSERTTKAEEDRSALPAAASWADGAHLQQPSTSKAVTQDTFGPSLSDALNTPQKSKTSPTLPRVKAKKEKKKAKAVLADSDTPTAKTRGSKGPTMQKQERQHVMLPEEQGSEPVTPEKEEGTEQHVEESMSAMDEEAFTDAPPADEGNAVVETEEHTAIEKVDAAHLQEEAGIDKIAGETMDSDIVTGKIKQDIDTSAQLTQDTVHETPIEDNTDVYENEKEAEEETAVQTDEMERHVPNAIDAEFADAIDSTQYLDIEESNDMDELQKPIETEVSDKVQEVDVHASMPSPMAIMEHVSTFVDQGADHFKQPGVVQRAAPPPPLVQQHSSLAPFMGDYSPVNNSQRRASPGPPPGFGSLPLDWFSDGIPSFNGQDPALTSRRLQHSQQMLEASGLFRGFGAPMPGFGVPPAPSFPPHMMGQAGFYSGLPPPMIPRSHSQPLAPPRGPLQAQRGPLTEHGTMDGLNNRFGDLALNHQRDDSRKSRDDLRALLPNVNISFGLLQDELARPKPLQGFPAKPHTPETEDQSRRSSTVLDRLPNSSIPTELTRSPLNPAYSLPKETSNQSAFNVPPPHYGTDQTSAEYSSQLPPPGFYGKMSNDIHKPDASPGVSAISTSQNMDQYESFGPMPPSSSKASFHDAARSSMPPPSPGRQADMRQEAQLFFGEFLKKAASAGYKRQETDDAENTRGSAPFQDPAIMTAHLGQAQTRSESRYQSPTPQPQPQPQQQQHQMMQLSHPQQPQQQSPYHQQPHPYQQQQQQQQPTHLLHEPMVMGPESVGRGSLPVNSGKPMAMYMQPPLHSFQQHQQHLYPPSHYPMPPPPPLSQHPSSFLPDAMGRRVPPPPGLNPHPMSPGSSAAGYPGTLPGVFQRQNGQ